MNILFMCVANSARSQIAEGLGRHFFSNENIQSAGSAPGKINPFAIAVMKEVGIDISHQYSKAIEDLPAEFRDNIDYVITLCAEEVCPVVLAPKAKRLHWPIPDPASKEKFSEEEFLARFREAREVITRKLQDFKTEQTS